MKKLIRRIINWATREEVSRPTALADCHPGNNSAPNLRIGVIKAMNGRILEMATYKPNPHGPDWTTELFIIPEDQTLAQAVSMVLALKGADK